MRLSIQFAVTNWMLAVLNVSFLHLHNNGCYLTLWSRAPSPAYQKIHTGVTVDNWQLLENCKKELRSWRFICVVPNAPTLTLIEDVEHQRLSIRQENKHTFAVSFIRVRVGELLNEFIIVSHWLIHRFRYSGQMSTRVRSYSFWISESVLM